MSKITAFGEVRNGGATGSSSAVFYAEGDIVRCFINLYGDDIPAFTVQPAIAWYEQSRCMQFAGFQIKEGSTIGPEDINLELEDDNKNAKVKITGKLSERIAKEIKVTGFMRCVTGE